MKLGVAGRRCSPRDVVRTVWLQLPATARWALVARYGRNAPGEVKLGDIAAYEGGGTPS